MLPISPRSRLQTIALSALRYHRRAYGARFLHHRAGAELALPNRTYRFAGRQQGSLGVRRARLAQHLGGRTGRGRKLPFPPSHTVHPGRRAGRWRTRLDSRRPVDCLRSWRRLRKRRLLPQSGERGRRCRTGRSGWLHSKAERRASWPRAILLPSHPRAAAWPTFSRTRCGW